MDSWHNLFYKNFSCHLPAGHTVTPNKLIKNGLITVYSITIVQHSHVPVQDFNTNGHRKTLHTFLHMI